MDLRGMEEASGTCPSCGHGNGPDARFCAQCGTPLIRACPVCSNLVGHNDRFCSHCGTALTAEQPGDGGAHDLRRYVPDTLLHKIHAARATGSMRGERRTVTMLFADLQGSTAAAERLDPEEWAEIVNGAFEHLIAPVYRYEGTLARLQGDAILAFFGAPIAHEDDPLRAVRAGLDMQDAVVSYAEQVRQRTGVPIAVRVGINTGLVVVGEVGSDLRVEYTALGDAINVAARMEQTADPGTVRITEDTAGLLGRAVTMTEIGDVEVKGKAAPVRAYHVTGVTDEVAAGPAGAPLVGRAVERDRVVDAVMRLAGGVGGVVTVVGEAGIGKSRLIEEIRRAVTGKLEVADLSTEPGGLAWLTGNVRSYDRAVPYAPFLDMARRWLSIGSGGDHAARERLDRSVAALEPHLGEELDPDLPAYLAYAGGLPLNADERALIDALDTPILHERTTGAMLSYFEAEARRRPVLLVLEDLHWADALSLALVERLMAAADEAPLGLLLTLRPVRDDPAWRLVETASREIAHRHTALQLEALEEYATSLLLDRLLGGRQLSPEDRERIVRRAGGNPLFLEEIVGSLETGDAARVPASLSGLLSARLDQLDEAERLIAEVAAVIGQEFDIGALRALTGSAFDVTSIVAGLVRRGVLVQRPGIGRSLYAFRHALIQEAAYGTILLKERRRLHGELGRYLADAAPDAPHEVARHYLASDQQTAAFPWLVQAAALATRRMALAEAIDLFTTALEQMPADADPDLVAQAHLGLGEAYSLVPDLDRSSAAYQSLADYGRAEGQPSMAVSALNLLGINAAVLGGDFITADSYLEDARALAEETGDEEGLAKYHMNACFLAATRGDLGSAVHHDDETARLGAQLGAEDTRAEGLSRRVLNLITSTEFTDEQIQVAMDEAFTAALNSGRADLQAQLRANGDSLLSERDGRVAEALAILQEAIEVFERYGSYMTPMSQQHAGRLALWLGRLDLAEALLAAGRDRAERRHRFTLGTVAATQALLATVLGDDAEGERHRTGAREAMRTPVADFMASTLWCDLGNASILQGELERAAADFATGLEASSMTRFWERPRLLTGAAEVAVRRGDHQHAHDLIEDASAFATERRMPVHFPWIGYVAGLLAVAEGRHEDAARTLEQAGTQAEASGLRLLACRISAARIEVAATTGADPAVHERHLGVLIAGVAESVPDPAVKDRLAQRLRTGGLAPPAPRTQATMDSGGS